MKKLLLSVFAITFATHYGNAQVTSVIEAPQYNGGTTTGRAPNGTSAHAYMRGAELVLASELTNIPVNTTLTAFGFTLSAPASAACTGNFTVYLENTSDVTYQKGTTWANIITGMTQVYGSTMIVPGTGTYSVMVTLSTPFVYTGGGLYVAYDWYSSGPYAGTAATYLCEYQALSPGCASDASPSSAPAVLTSTTTFRPSLLFGFPNPNTNDMQVVGVDAPGNVNVSFNTAHTIKGVVRNGSNVPLSNISVSLNVTGANTFNDVQIITSLAAGATTSVNFAAFNPTVLGANSISVSVATDQNNTNNSATYSQSVSCNYMSQNPSSTSYTASGGVGFGTGSGLIVTPLIPPVNATLTGIRGSVSSNAASLGRSIYAVLLNAAGTILATTNTITIATLSTVQDFTFALPQNVTASTTYYIGFAQPANATAYYPAGSIASVYVTPGLYYATAITGGAPVLQTSNLGYLDIEGIFANNFITTSASPAAICLGGQVDLISAGTAVSYTWSTGAQTFSTTDTPSITTTYSIAGENAYGCTNTKTISVTVFPLPAITAMANPSAVCLGNSVGLMALGGAFSYTWTSPSGILSFPSDTPSVTTIYTVTGTNANGCISTNTLEVEVNSFTMSVSPSTTICKGDTITLTANGADTYMWSNNAQSPSIMVSPNTSTNYAVNGTAFGNCVITESINITVNPRPSVAVISSKTLACTHEAVKLTAVGANSYTWSAGSGNSSTTTISSTTPTNMIITVVGSNTLGCTSTATLTQLIRTCTGVDELSTENNTPKIYPNPNNGVFTVELATQTDNAKIEIRNAIGQLVKEQIISSNSVEIDMKEEANGIYFIYISSPNGTKNVWKIMKQ